MQACELPHGEAGVEAQVRAMRIVAMVQEGGRGISLVCRLSPYIS